MTNHCHLFIFYAVNKQNAGWKTQSVDMGNKDTAWFPSFSLDDKGTPHIFYADHEDQKLQCATLINNKWKTKTLSTGRGGWWTSSRFSNGKLYVAHTKLPDTGWDYASLEVGVLENDQWKFEIVDPNHNAGWFTTMALFPNGNPIVSYNSVVGQPVGAVKLASRDLDSLVSELESKITSQVQVSEGYFIHFGGQFESQKSASRLILLLGLLSLAGIFVVLYAHFKSSFIAAQIMLNIPMALIGSLIAIFLSDKTFSIATMVAFVTLCVEYQSTFVQTMGQSSLQKSL